MRIVTSLIALFSIVAGACGPGSDAGRTQGAATGAPGLDDTRTLVIAMRTEPKVFLNAALNPSHVGNTPDAPWQLFHAALTMGDERGTPQLQLAEEFPQLGTDSWKVFPDGRMETTWRLRPNLTWHDGAPLVAEDFVLSAQFMKMLGQSSGAVPAIEEASAPDSRTLVLWYKAPTAVAGQTALQSIPHHLLGAQLEQMEGRDPVDLFGLPYWTTEFKGLGPYRLERWEHGAFITGVAFPGYVNGKPRIARIQLVWISDANTAASNLLSGTVHLATDLSLVFEQVSVLRREWAAKQTTGNILLGTAKTVYIQMQYRPEHVNPRAILDARFRQAIAHAIDKQAIVDAVLEGEPGIADTLRPKEEESYAELDRVLAKHPFDLRRTDQLLTEMGFAKDAEGFYGQGGARLVTSLTPRGDYLREALVLSDGWKRAGLDVPIRTLSAAEQLDSAFSRTYPALSIIQFQIDAYPFQPFVTGVSPNVGGFSDPEVDRLSSIYASSLDRQERNQTLIQGMKYLSDQAVYFPLYYGYDVIAHTGSLAGPRSGIKKYAMWRVEEWTWR